MLWLVTLRMLPSLALELKCLGLLEQRICLISSPATQLSHVGVMYMTYALSLWVRSALI